MRRVGAGDVFGVSAGQGKRRKLQRIRAIRRCFARGDQLVRRGHGVAQDGGHLHEKVFRERRNLRPFGNVGAELQLVLRLGLSNTKVDALLVNVRVKCARNRLGCVVRNVSSGGEHAVVPCGRCNRARVHQDNAGQLTVSGLRALAVREVARRVADGEGVVGRNVARAEAGAAEAGLKQRTSLQKLLLHAVSDELEIHGDGRGINGEGEIAAAYVEAV